MIETFDESINIISGLMCLIECEQKKKIGGGKNRNQKPQKERIKLGMIRELMVLFGCRTRT